MAKPRGGAKSNPGNRRQRRAAAQEAAKQADTVSSPPTTNPVIPATDVSMAPAAAGASDSQRRSQDQIRASFALCRVKQHFARDDQGGNYRAYARALPSGVIRSGLGQALAMEKAREKLVGHELLFGDLSEWLSNEWKTSPYHGQDDVIAAIMNGSEADYVRAQVEVIALLRWIKVFSEAYLPRPSDREDVPA